MKLRNLIKLANEAGFGLIEAMLSLAILGVSFAGYVESVNAAVRSSKRQLDRQDLIMARSFVRKHFSCEKTFKKIWEKGVNKCPSKALEAKTYDGRLFASSSGVDFGTNPGSEPFSLKAVCRDSASGPSISFVAARKGINPITGKSYTNPMSLSTYSKASNEDVTQGNEIFCVPSTPPPPPTSPDTCSVGLVDANSGAALNDMPGPFFRAPGVVNNDLSWASKYDVLRVKFAWRVLVKGESAGPDMDNNKPDKFEIQFVNKDPSTSLAFVRDRDRWKQKVVSLTGSYPDNEMIAAGNKPLPGEVFTIDAQDVKQNTSQIAPNCANVGTGAQAASGPSKIRRKTGATAQQTFCSTTYSWQSDILPVQTQNGSRKNPESDWYDSPVDMKVTALRGNARIATCTTSFSLRSPLVLLWPEAPSGDSSTPFRIQTSLTRFDIDGDGVKEPMGWVAGKAGFLALDLNGNDIIDDGRELFGDATMLLAKDGMHAVNGFEALAQYDDNQDSVINQKDAVMSRLIVWFDSDSDGDSDPSELVPIAMMGVERIDLRYQSVREGPQGSGGLVQARYEARFFGKDLCNGAGCPVYDLYFAKGSSKEASTGSLDVGGRPQ